MHTDGHSGAGVGHRKRRWREKVDGNGTEPEYRRVKQPKYHEDYFQAACIIDVHNHRRQGGLVLEEVWGTIRWENRLAATLIGMCETDALLAWNHFHWPWTSASSPQIIWQVMTREPSSRAGFTSIIITPHSKSST